MKNRKKGFTLSEVLVCITIIGVVMALSVNTLKIVKSSYSSLAYFEYNNIKDMVTSLMSGISAIQNNDNLPISTVNCRLTNGRIVTILKPDSTGDVNSGNIQNCSASGGAGGNGNSFCRTIVEISGTAGATHCDNLFTADFDTEPYISDIEIDNPTFIATNGRRYYITSHTQNDDVSEEYGFRLIAVDLNGKSGPNIYTHGNNPPTKQSPDIITFLVMDNGEIYPLGIAADNISLGETARIQYINSRVKGYYFSDAERGTTPAECTRKSKDGTKQICNYGVINIPNPMSTERTSTIYTYRQAYCSVTENPTYKAYCNGINKNPQCPPTGNNTGFDLCVTENIKPSFRYNL